MRSGCVCTSRPSPECTCRWHAMGLLLGSAHARPTNPVVAGGGCVWTRRGTPGRDAEAAHRCGHFRWPRVGGQIQVTVAAGEVAGGGRGQRALCRRGHTEEVALPGARRPDEPVDDVERGAPYLGWRHGLTQVGAPPRAGEACACSPGHAGPWGLRPHGPAWAPSGLSSAGCRSGGRSCRPRPCMTVSSSRRSMRSCDLPGFARSCQPRRP